MKLYVEPCAKCGNRVYLNIEASSKSELRRRLSSSKFTLTCSDCRYKNAFSVSQVKAEAETQAAISGGIVGGLVGIIGGPIGMLLGGALGASIGGSADSEEVKKVNFFNHSV